MPFEYRGMIFSESQFQASCLYGYLETWGLVGGGIGHRVTGSLPQPAGHLASVALQPAKDFEAKNKLLTLTVFSASTNWRPMFPSGTLTVARCLLSSAKVKFLALVLMVSPEPALEAVSANSF
jgi:hypothetical protein